MIKVNKSIYLKYIKDMKHNVDDFVNKMSHKAVSDLQKQDIYGLRLTIISKLDYFKAKVSAGLISNADWVNLKQEIDGLYNELLCASQQVVDEKICIRKIKTANQLG